MLPTSFHLLKGVFFELDTTIVSFEMLSQMTEIFHLLLFEDVVHFSEDWFVLLLKGFLIQIQLFLAHEEWFVLFLDFVHKVLNQNLQLGVFLCNFLTKWLILNNAILFICHFTNIIQLSLYLSFILCWLLSSFVGVRFISFAIFWFILILRTPFLIWSVVLIIMRWLSVLHIVDHLLLVKQRIHLIELIHLVQRVQFIRLAKFLN